MFRYLKLCLKNEFKDYLAVVLAMSLFLSFEYMIWNIFFCVYGHFTSYGEQFFYNFSTLALMIIIFIMILFINYFFTDKKKKEFSLILMCGRKTTEIIGFLIMQYGAIFILSNVISMIIGKIILEVLSTYLYAQHHIVLQFHTFNALGMFFLIEGLILIYIMLINFGMFIRLETKIVNLISHNTAPAKPSFLNSLGLHQLIKTKDGKQKKRKKVYMHLGIILIMILSLIGIFFKAEPNQKIVIHICANLSFIALINFTIPYLFDILHKRLFQSVILLVGSSNIMHMVRSMLFLINLSSLLIPVTITFMVVFSMGMVTQVYMVIYTLMILVMLFISMIFKLSLMIETKQAQQQTLRTLGVNHKQIRKIKQIEFNVFYVIAVIMPMILSFLLLYSGVCQHVIEIDFAQMIVIEYLTGALISYLVIYIQYRKIYRKEIKVWQKNY